MIQESINPYNKNRTLNKTYPWHITLQVEDETYCIDTNTINSTRKRIRLRNTIYETFCIDETPKSGNPYYRGYRYAPLDCIIKDELESQYYQGNLTPNTKARLTGDVPFLRTISLCIKFNYLHSALCCAFE